MGSPVFFPPQKTALLTSNSIWTSGPLLITVLATEWVTLLKYRLLLVQVEILEDLVSKETVCCVGGKVKN